MFVLVGVSMKVLFVILELIEFEFFIIVVIVLLVLIVMLVIYLLLIDEVLVRLVKVLVVGKVFLLV